MTTSTANGQFQTVNGQIIDPNGNVFTADGINLYDSQMGDASQILTDFPNLNFIRLNVYSYQSPSAYQAFIQTMTSHGIVVELEDHTNSTGSNSGGGQGNAFTGTQLNNELSWYSSVASAYASNPYVWFGTNNEPPQAGLSTWEQETYNAVRSAGNNSPVMMELPGGGYPGSTLSGGYGMDPTVYTSMTNIIADPHFYGWAANYSTDQGTVNATLAAEVTGVQSMQSASGTVPVIIGEYGPSTDGQNTDANGSQVLTAVQSAAQSGETSGAVAWGWNSGANDNLTDGSGNLTSYGQEVAQWSSSMPAPSGSGTTPSGSGSSGSGSSGAGSTGTSTAPASANDSVVLAGSTAAITDASGNAWTITSGGQVAVNGTPDATTGNVIELVYVNGTIWQENASDLWWGETQPNAAWAQDAGTSTSPLPASAPTPPTTPTKIFTPSADDTVVKAGSTAALTDAAGNVWTITAGGQIAVNGVLDTTTSNVTELATVKGEIWQENASNLWWGKTTPTAAWSPTPGTATSPLPPPPAPIASANDTVVMAGSTAAITDASGNAWTITSGGQIAVNGVTDATTAHVTELAYVGGEIWQENASNLWWGKTTPTAAWSPTPGTATSPLPPPAPVASPNDMTVLAGATTAITDAAGNSWTITAGGQVAVNGTADTTTANVTELAYVNGMVWQENASNLWWDKTSPSAAWASGNGTATSPLPAAQAIAANSTNATVSQSEVAAVATSGKNMVFIKGSNDVVTLSGGTNTVTDTGHGNVYVMPAAGKGSVTFTGNILTQNDVLDLKPALAATNWAGTSATLSGYLKVTDSTAGANITLSATSGGHGSVIGMIDGSSSLNLTSLLAHAIT